MRHFFYLFWEKFIFCFIKWLARNYKPQVWVQLHRHDQAFLCKLSPHRTVEQVGLVRLFEFPNMEQSFAMHRILCRSVWIEQTNRVYYWLLDIHAVRWASVYWDRFRGGRHCHFPSKCCSTSWSMSRFQNRTRSHALRVANGLWIMQIERPSPKKILNFIFAKMKHSFQSGKLTTWPCGNVTVSKLIDRFL